MSNDPVSVNANIDLAKQGDLIPANLNKKVYPSPYLDIGNTEIPNSIKEMFSLLRRIYYWSPVIRPIIKKLAEYPVTPITIKTKDVRLKEKWEDFIDIIDLEVQHKTIGHTYFTFGNSFTSVVFPMYKFLKCPKCKFRAMENEFKWVYKNYAFQGKCPKCGFKVYFEQDDVYSQADKNVFIKHWPPERIEIVHNEISGHNTYFYNMSIGMKRMIKEGNKDIVTGVPKDWLLASKKNERIRLNQQNFIHLKQVEIADDFSAWGIPLPISVLALDFYLKILRKAQEAICFEHIVPLRIIFPSAQGSADPFRNQDLGQWKSTVETELKQWRRDPNRISLLPFPIGTENFGGDAKMLSVWEEIKGVSIDMCVGMGIPQEILYGGLSWSGTQISMRLFENYLDSFRQDLVRFDEDLVRILTSHYTDLGKPEDITMEMRDFRMADDAQRTEILQNLNAVKKVSDETLAQRFNIDLKSERELVEKDLDWQKKIAIKSGEMEGEVRAKAEFKYSSIMQKLQESMQVNMGQLVENYKQELGKMDPKERDVTLNTISKTNPNLLEELTKSPMDQEQTPVSPALPGKLPPRRNDKTI